MHNILIRNEEFLYGSYFDHDRFEGNTGTRLTSGDYGKIRSADALLPAQDITIKVTDTDLTNYKVTLGYFDKNGNNVSLRKHCEGSKAKFGAVLCLDCIDKINAGGNTNA